jgi:hypothetical protein
MAPMFGEFDHPCLSIALQLLLESGGVASWNPLHFPPEVFNPIPVPAIAFIATAVSAQLLPCL